MADWERKKRDTEAGNASSMDDFWDVGKLLTARATVLCPNPAPLRRRWRLTFLPVILDPQTRVPQIRARGILPPWRPVP